jgi:nitrogen regulatory protein P-II 1
MKMIVAIIQPDKLEEVHQALMGEEINRITVSRVTGHGQARDTELYRGQEIVPNLIPKVRIEIAVNDAFVEPTIRAILKGARHGTGEIGDGKIFVMPLEDVVRIRTGERGGDAI